MTVYQSHVLENNVAMSHRQNLAKKSLISSQNNPNLVQYIIQKYEYSPNKNYLFSC